MKEYVRKYGGAHLIPITDQMIHSVGEAKQMDDQRKKEEADKKSMTDKEIEILEEEKKRAEENLKMIADSKQTLDEHDKEIHRKEGEAREALKVAQGLLKHGTDRLVTAKGDKSAIGVTTVMIQSAQEKMDEVNEQFKKLDEERQRFRKRKSQLINNCESQLKKKKT